MKAVKIHIKRLGAVRDSSIEMKPLMVFSGESGLGKSYVAFLIHYIYVLLNTPIENNRLISYFSEDRIHLKNLFDQKKSGQVILDIAVKDVFDWINKDAISYIGYLIGHSEFQGDVDIKFPYSEVAFRYKFEEEITGVSGHEDLYYKISLGRFTYNILAQTINEFRPDYFAELLRVVLLESFFGDFRRGKVVALLPPSRGAVMDLLERPKFRSGMYLEFWDFKTNLFSPSLHPSTLPSVIKKCLASVNKGEILQEGDKLMYYTTDGVLMPLSASASSIKELAPLTLMLGKYDSEKLSVLLEEPEAHLHPQRQVQVADLIGCMINLGSHLQITTHSDYFIKRLNNLIKLYILKDIISEEELQRLIGIGKVNADSLINPAVVGAFFLRSNNDGTSTVVPQDIREFDEIPFDSFYGVIEEDLELSREIRKVYGIK